MAELFYKFLLKGYRGGIAMASLFNSKAKKARKGRKKLLKSISKALEDNTAPIIWIHCASLGEFEQGRPVIERLNTVFPEYKIALTFFSPSGYEVSQNYEHADYIFYLPWDSASNAEKFISLLNPSMAIFVKYEFWHYFIKELHHRNIPVISISAIFRKSQIYFKPYGTFYLNILKKLTHIFVQNRQSEVLLRKFGIEQVTLGGDTRFDRVSTIIAARKSLRKVREFKGDDEIMVIGSVWPEDLDVILPFINSVPLKFIIAPHEINGKCQDRIVNEIHGKTLLYSDIDKMEGDEQVLVIDNIGLLSSLYGYGEYAYVGGAFGAGLHNILEAAVYGIPVFFGNKNYKKFNEAVELIKLGGAVAIGTDTELREKFHSFKDEATMQIARQVNRGYVKENTGATEKIISYCLKILS